MFSPQTIIRKYLSYWFGSFNGKGHGIHSPFVFEFIQQVLNDRHHYAEYEIVEQLRRKLLMDRTPVPAKDYGAGSAIAGSAKTVAAIVKQTAKNAKYGQLLFRIARYYKPKYLLELGTSMGISTAYLASASTNSVVVSGEGNEVIAMMAGNNLSSIGIDNVKIISGNFDDTLPQLAAGLPQVDLAFVDGNHREQPTINYFNELVKYIPAEAIMIFDDIHWSAGMESAWRTIKDHPSVMLTIDLFFIGIVFFRPEFKVKQHFRIRF